jgi:hypothetical protein
LIGTYTYIKNKNKNLSLSLSPRHTYLLKHQTHGELKKKGKENKRRNCIGVWRAIDMLPENAMEISFSFSKLCRRDIKTLSPDFPHHC